MEEDATFGVTRDRRIGAEVQGRYRILRKLGEGGMGAVYEAEHMLIRKRVAIKTLHPHLSQSAQAVARFRREAMAATATHNEHVVEVTDMGQFDDDGALFLVLEYLDGRNLADELNAVGPMPLGRVARIVCQICDALSVLHAQGIIHRDLKPENLFLIRRGDDPDFVKILDFGISKFKTSLDGQPTQLTAEGMMVGTAHFMSPEQAAGSADVDHRTDLYALGGIIYTMLTAVFAFEAETLPALFIKVATEPPPPVQRRRSDLPADVVEAVNRCLAKKPADRFQSADEVRSVFARHRHVQTQPVLRQSSLPPPQAAPEPVSAAATGQDRSRKGRPRMALALGGAVALAGLLAVGTLALRRSGATQSPAPAIRAPEPPPLAPVRLRIWTAPAGAELWLDGNPIPNPYDDERPPSDAVHAIEARLDGASVQRSVRFDRDQNLRLELTPPTVSAHADEPPEQAAAARPRRTVERSQPATAKATPEAAPANTPAPAPAPDVAAPVEAETPASSSPAEQVLGKRALKRPKF
jgi:serine/threonine-protein kinase